VRATEIIRNLLNVIDTIETSNQPDVSVSIARLSSNNESDPITDSWQDNRYKQIEDLLSNEDDLMNTFSNTPTPKISDLDSVIMSGDDVNKSKHPSDIRANSISLYPNFQAKE